MNKISLKGLAIGTVFAVLSSTEPADAGQVQDLVRAASASSVLLENGYDYGPWRVLDRDPATTWTEGAQDQGYGEYLELYTDNYAVITGGVIYPGYWKNSDLFYKNSAPRQLYIRTGEQEAYLDCTEYASNWYDNFGGYHFVFDEPLVSDGTVRVTIAGVRSGWKYSDTCISELRFEGHAGTEAEATDLLQAYDQETPHASIARPADDMNVTLEQVTWQEEELRNDPNMFTNPDGIGGDGLEPGERPDSWEDYWEGTANAQYLDGGRAMMLTAFASALYKMQCQFANPENKTIQSSKLYSFSHAYMLYWYQYNVPDSRILSDTIYHYAEEKDLVKIVQELFTSVDEQTARQDVEYFCERYAVSRANGTVMMEATGDFGDAGTFYLSEPFDAAPDGERILLTGNVLAFDPPSQVYVPVMPYYAYFIQDDGEPSIFRFDELVCGTGG